MKIESKNLPRGQAELTVEISVEEFQPFLEQAAKKISEAIKIPGFRPGKAGLDIIKAKVGEADIWQEAFEPAVKKTLLNAISEQKLDVVGQPQVDVVKLAPGNPVVYKAVVSLLPTLTLGDYKSVEVKEKPIEIKADAVEKVLVDLQKMRASEVVVDRPAKKGDKVEIDFETFLDKIPLDNGKNLNHPVIIGDQNFIPGFEDQLIDLKKGEEKTFQLKFPEKYHQKNLEGKLVDFKVKVNEVSQRTLPELNDDFAKALGEFKTLAEAKEKIKENLEHEAEHEEEHRLEDEVVEKLIGIATFGEIPDLLANAEAKKMVEELSHNIQAQGLKFEDYLAHMKKTRDDLLLDFAPQAIKRVKSALIIREIAKQENIKVSDEEINAEAERMLNYYGHDPEIKKNLETPAYKDYLANVLTSKKTMEAIMGWSVK